MALRAALATLMLVHVACSSKKVNAFPGSITLRGEGRSKKAERCPGRENEKCIVNDVEITIYN